MPGHNLSNPSVTYSQGVNTLHLVQMRFYQHDLKSETLWRAIVLFGRNVASYKFALAESLMASARAGKTFLTLDDLAPSFSAAICRHIKDSQKQGTSQSSKFLKACEDFNHGKITRDSLVETTVKHGFNNVIDAFHVVNSKNVPVQFFVDERKHSKGITLTDELLEMCRSSQSGNLPHEVEARWRLVETAWALGIAPSLLQVSYDEPEGLLLFRDATRRIAITSCRDSLSGYQKGLCFYSKDAISLEPLSQDLCDVDHFFPHKLKEYSEFQGINLDGVWNLVLSCKHCNRGYDGKFAKVPSLGLLTRLHCRNEYYINSHHPLRETIINQTGQTEQARKYFLQQVFDAARSRLIHTWEPEGGFVGENI